MHYKEKSFEQIQEANWDVKSCVRCVSGANLDTTNLPEGTKRIIKGTPLMLDGTTKKLKVVKTATVVANAAANATKLHIVKGSLFKVGDSIAGSTISAIDTTTNEEKDILTVSALAEAVTKDSIVSDGNGDKVVGLAYATTPIDDYTSLTWTIQAYEIKEATLPHPLTDAIKEALTSRHHYSVL